MERKLILLSDIKFSLLHRYRVKNRRNLNHNVYIFHRSNIQYIERKQETARERGEHAKRKPKGGGTTLLPHRHFSGMATETHKHRGRGLEGGLWFFLFKFLLFSSL